MSGEEILTSEESNTAFATTLRQQAKLALVKKDEFMAYFLNEAADRLEAADQLATAADEVISDVHVSQMDCSAAQQRIKRYWDLRKYQEKRGN